MDEQLAQSTRVQKIVEYATVMPRQEDTRHRRDLEE